MRQMCFGTSFVKAIHDEMRRDGIKLALLEVAAQYSVLALERAHERPIFGSPGFQGILEGVTRMGVLDWTWELKSLLMDVGSVSADIR